MRGLAALLLLAGCAAGAAPGAVGIPSGDVTLNAPYAVPSGPAVAPSIVALHGCGGPFPVRDGQWRDLFVASGHAVVLPDSFGSRGLGSQCSNPARDVTPNGKRRGDAVAAAQWLAAQPGTPAGGVVVMGWSNGGSTVLAAAAEGGDAGGAGAGVRRVLPGVQLL